MYSSCRVHVTRRAVLKEPLSFPLIKRAKFQNATIEGLQGLPPDMENDELIMQQHVVNSQPHQSNDYIILNRNIPLSNLPSARQAVELGHDLAGQEDSV